MCEIFPEVTTCCFLVSLRLGMLFISVFCIMTGVTSLCILEQTNNVSFDNIKNITDISKPDEVLSRISNLITSGITTMSYLFMFSGLLLFFASISDDEGLAQGFVWLTFLAVVIGYVLVAVIAVECTLQSKCLLSKMDWLSGATLLVLAVGYLCCVYSLR
ncbi:uncharacterized protein LOC131845489 isoform X2 [Achroia grisella]|uniref:uncharacterized protein LOC131845489 isoform X2 n=1 Tax=Achroia grisella TaxID=688607 RepID=UPI0027D2C19C|nr:uncharacterized protein LOC131845489 isoform X2 [Achroia grisella]